jgi:hypothetical protein
MMLTAVITLSFAAVAAALALARVDYALAQDRGAVAAAFGDAMGTFIAWIAFASTLVSGLIGIGIPITFLLAAACLLTARLTPALPALVPIFPFKLPLAIFAILLSIASLVWVLTLVQGAITNV